MSVLSTLLAVAVLVAVTLGIVLALRLEHPWLQPWAILRAVLQLGILSLVLSGIIRSPILVGLFLVVMLAAAVWTIARRLRLTLRGTAPVALVTLVAAAIPVTIVFLTGAVDFSPRYVLAVGGIVIGNTMTVSTLLGRNLGSQIVLRRDELEAWFSLGATPRQAAAPLVRSAASTALIPTTDQTRTTGLVTLPGAFVGSIFGGASPLVAAEFQLVVLAAILATSALAVAGLGFLFGAPKTIPLSEQPLG
jgi:putative ABC transport system permease protein